MPNLLQSQLAFFGAVDNAVLYAQRGNGPHPNSVLRTVESLLPGTTGFGQAGWYGELEDFANRTDVRVDDAREQVRFPTVAEALRDLRVPVARPEPSVTAGIRGGRRPADDPFDPTHEPALARSAYAAMILAKLARLQGLPTDLDITRTIPERILASAISLWQGSTIRMTAPRAAADPTVQDLLSRLDDIESPQDWRLLVAQSVDPLFAEQSVPCSGKLDNVDGQYISTLYTDATDTTLKVSDIEKIIDPQNWTLACKFFCEVVSQKPSYTRSGWSRILETISPEPEKWSLRTALVFYYARDDAGGIFLNYDLDPHRQNDSGIVEVDKGYIWITPTRGSPGRKGVRIRTSKQERVQGLSPTATSALGCLLGWGDAAYKLLAGAAEVVVEKKVPPGVVIHPFSPTPPTGYESDVDHATQQQPNPATPATLPPIFGSAVRNARDLLNDLINRTRDVGADAADRWLDGVSRDDVEKITDGIGTNLREFALEVYQIAEDSVKPKDTTTAKGRR